MNLLKLNQTFSTERVFPLLDFPSVSDSIVGGCCPFCGSTDWSVQQDPVSLDQWQHCPQCNRYGSPLAMASHALSLSLDDTLQHLVDRISPDSSESELNQYLEIEKRRSLFSRLWIESQQHTMIPTQAHVQLMCMMGWSSSSHFDGTKALNGPGQLFGFNICKNFVDLGISKLLRKTDECLVVPYFSGPQKIEGLRIITARHSEFLTVHPPSKLHTDPEVKGLAFYNYARQAIRDTVVVTSMLRPAGMLHIRNFSMSTQRLPVVAWNNDGKPHMHLPWSFLSGLSLILWEGKITAGVVQQAINHDALISYTPLTAFEGGSALLGPSPSTKNWINNKTPQTRVADIIRKAMPLNDVLRKWKSNATDAEVRTLLAEAETFPRDVFNRISRFTSKINIRTHRVPSDIRCEVKAGSDSIVLVERDQKVYDAKGKLRFPAIVRVTHVVTNKTADVHYSGSVITHYGNIPFNVPALEMTSMWFYDLLCTKQAHVVDYSGRLNRMDLLDADTLIKLSFLKHKPIFCKAAEKVGWDGEGFQFAHLRIENGKVTRTPACMVYDKGVGPDTGSLSLTVHSKTVFNRNTRTAELCWNAAVALSAVASSPMVGLLPLPVLVGRDVYDSHMTALFRGLNVRHTKAKEWDHNWFFRYKPMVSSRASIVPAWSVVSTPEVTETAVARSPGYLIKSNHIKEFDNTVDSLSYMVLHYLRHVSAIKLHAVTMDWEQWHRFTVQQMRKCFFYVQSDVFNKRTRLITTRF